MADYGDLGIYVKNLTDNVSTDPDFDVSGSGIFDNLMESVNSHIQAQYNAGRILASEYSTVYMNAIQAVLNISSSILLDQKLREKQAEETAARTALLEEQKNTEIKKNTLLDQQILSEVENTRLIKNNADKANYELSSILPAQLDEINSKVSLIDQQQLTEVENTSKVAYEVANILPAQKALLTAQESSELKKVGLIQEQTNGFIRDAKQKYIKSLLDAWSVMFSVDQSATSIPVIFGGTASTDFTNMLSSYKIDLGL